MIYATDIRTVQNLGATGYNIRGTILILLEIKVDKVVRVKRVLQQVRCYRRWRRNAVASSLK